MRFWSSQFNPGRRLSVDDNGSNSEVDVLIAEPFPSGSVSQQVVIAPPPYGSDTTGDGTFSSPYATIAHAQSTITDASAIKEYEVIVMPGVYAEAVVLKPFTRLVGWDSTKNSAGFFPAHVVGAFTIDAQFAAAGSVASLTSIDVDGTFTLDFVAAGSADGHVVVSSCQLDDDVLLEQSFGNRFEIHDSICFGNFTQHGGNVDWYNTLGNTAAGVLTVRVGADGQSTYFTAFGGEWDGSLVADQNGVGGVACSATLFNFSVRLGVTVVASGATVPLVRADYGATIENPTLTGANAQLSIQMRVWQDLQIPINTAIGATGTTNIALTLPAAVLRATPIQSMVNSAAPWGDWSDLLVTHGCSVTWYFLNPDVVHAAIYNPGAGFNTAAALNVRYSGYLPEPPP